jgi:quercetin dioxygenase-like cupin family protein
MKVVALGQPLPHKVENNPIFKGDVLIQSLVAPPEAEELRVSAITFRAGGRTPWHRHSTDQMLLVTAGNGFVENDTSLVHIRIGDFVFIPAGERHAHGALGESEMTHVALMRPGENDIEDD